jgi:hypothetical protein
MTTDNFCLHLRNRLIQTSQTGGQWYNDTSPFSIPWSGNIKGGQRYSDASYFLGIAGRSLKIVTAPTSFDAARRTCRRLGGKMPLPEDAEQLGPIL